MSQTDNLKPNRVYSATWIEGDEEKNVFFKTRGIKSILNLISLTWNWM